LAQSLPRRRVRSLYDPPSLVLKQAFSLACHGWLTRWRGFPGWMLKGRKVLATAAGAVAIGCTGYPYHVVWEVTTRCNLDCIHCYAGSVDSTQTELSTAEGKRLLDQIAEIDKFRMIVITGGEPLLRKDIFELVEYAGQLGFKIIFSTNGTLLTPEMAGDLARLGVVNFSISLDGFTADCHESIRRKPGSYQGAIDGLKAAARTGVCLQVNFTAMRRNLPELPGVIDLAESLKADIVMVFQAVPPQGERESLELDADEQLHLIRTIAEKQRQSSALLMPVCCPEYWPWLAGQRRFSLGRGIWNKAFSGCGAGRGFAYVRSDGEVWPCNFIPLSAGSVRQQSFPEIWNSSALLGELRGRPRKLGGDCAGCFHQGICGGCRGRAFARVGDLFAVDPLCRLGLKK
jgi:AdoMet-dependent heme synthase